ERAVPRAEGLRDPAELDPRDGTGVRRSQIFPIMSRGLPQWPNVESIRMVPAPVRPRALLGTAGLILVVALAGCHGPEPAVSRETAAPAEAPAARPQAPAAQATPDARPLVVFLGHSLTAGFNIDAEDAYPPRVGRALA